jgi:hypothetical protein
MASSCVEQSSSTQKDDSGGEIVRIDTPNPNDVLCGRGGNINSHRGNEQFRAFVEKRKRVYLTARFKREKRLIASSIVNEIRAMDPPGRFLARMGSLKDNNGYWYDIGNEKARDKTSQALRENAPSIRAEIETEINQQRAEMRRQETGDQQQQQQQPSTISSSSGGVGSSKDVHGRPIPGSAPSSSMYPPPPIGHHHPHPPGGPIHHGHGHPPPPHPPPPGPPPHPPAYNPHQQSHASYTQQYYDYYYHYYGYGAPPPPPPPGYQTGSGPPPPPSVAAGPAGAPPPAPAPPGAPPGYPPAPSPYWAATQPPSNVNSVNPAPGHFPHPATAATTSPPSSNSATIATTSQVKSTAMAMAPATINMNNNVNHNQEEDDRRMAMALQQQENVMAFEERNRRFGSDRKSSRSSAYCSPGYRPRLLNDRTPSLVDGGIGANGDGGTPTRKKRPAMSDSHFFSNKHPSGSNPVPLGHNNNMKSAPQPVGASSCAAAVAAAPSPISQQGIMDHRMAVALQHQEDNTHSHGSNASRKPSRSNAQRGGIGNMFGDAPANFMAWSRGGAGAGGAANNASTATTVSSTMEPNNNGNNNMEMNMSTNTNHHMDGNGYDMDRKPAAASTTRDDRNTQELYKEELDGLDHHNDFSCSSFNSRSRVQFKDDSDMLSMFGEGDTIVPPAGINSTGSFHRVRNTFAANNSSNSNSNNNHFSPIATNERNQHQPDQHHHQRDNPNRDNKNDANNQIHQRRQHQQQDPSLLSQVATHILGTLGGGSSWIDSDTKQVATTTTTSHQASPSTNHHHRQGRNNRNRSPEMEVESGQEVIMDVRDESSSMPPPQPRGSGVQIDWPSRAGCHTWIPDTIGASASAIFGQHSDGNEQHHDHHQEMAHANDHSLTRHNIYGRADISPINSMDMDFSHSSHVGESRRRNHDGGGGNSSLLNVFDQKNDDPNPEELLPHIHRSVLQQVPSWDRSFRSRSPLGDASVGGADEMDDSLIRVHSHDSMKPLGHDFHQRYQQPQHHHSQPAQPQTNHHDSHRDHHQQTLSSPQPQNYHHESRDMDMDWEEHAGE